MVTWILQHSLIQAYVHLFATFLLPCFDVWLDKLQLCGHKQDVRRCFLIFIWPWWYLFCAFSLPGSSFSYFFSTSLFLSHLFAQSWLNIPPYDFPWLPPEMLVLWKLWGNYKSYQAVKLVITHFPCPVPPSYAPLWNATCPHPRSCPRPPPQPSRFLFLVSSLDLFRHRARKPRALL